jgi:dethiobiotin synthetase
MSPRYVVTGTDTGIGKTVFAAALAGALDGAYWKPVQSGLSGGGDSERVAELSGLTRECILPERYRLTEPLSPHRAAERDGLEINVATLSPPDTRRPLVIEGAGGVMVPVTRQTLLTDVFADWNIPVILVARTALGTINHSLMSITALRGRGIPVHGIAFVGEANDDNERTICEMGYVRRLGRLPRLDVLNAATLREAFHANFRIEDFAP